MSIVPFKQNLISWYETGITEVERVYKLHEGKLLQKLTDQAPLAREPESQTELNRLFELYKTVIRRSQDTLIAQNNLAKNTIQQIQQSHQILELISIVSTFETSVNKSLEELHGLMKNAQTLQGQIIPLLPLEDVE